MAKRMFGHLHEKQPWHDGTFTLFAEEFSLRTPWHVSDGLTIWLAPVDADPGDEFLTDKYAKPASLRLVAEQTPGDEHKSG